MFVTKKNDYFLALFQGEVRAVFCFETTGDFTSLVVIVIMTNMQWWWDHDEDGDDDVDMMDTMMVMLTMVKTGLH